jgi:hypothetical protein
MTQPAEISLEDGVLVRHGFQSVDVGDIDQNRNLKIRMFIGPGLRPVFEDMQARLQFRQMGIDEGVAPGQYYQEFEAYPRVYGYDEELRTELRVSLQSALVAAREGAAERLVVETRGELQSRVVTGPARAVGFEPPLGEFAVAGRSRVIHMLTRPKAPPGERAVTEVPRQLEFLTPQAFEGDFPTIEILARVPDGYCPASPEGAAPVRGVWTMANSDVFQHVHAREYLYAMENRMGALAADADLPLDQISATRARVIFRRPSLVGERYELRCALFRQDDKLMALGSYHSVVAGNADDRPACFLRFEAELR